jgi:hypothetical protein
MEKKIDFNESFVIICESFEDRLDVYLNCIFDRYGVYKPDRIDYNSVTDYEQYQNIRWNSTDNFFVAHGNVGKLKSMSSMEFRESCGMSTSTPEILKKFRSGGCDSSLSFTFSFNKLEKENEI